MNFLGENNNPNSPCTTQVDAAATATEPNFFFCETSTTSGNVAGVGGSGNESRPGRNIWWSGHATPEHISNHRWWFGLFSNSFANMGAGNQPAATHIAAFLATSDTTGGASAANFNCVTSDSTTVRIVSSTVAVVANTGHKFDIREDTNSGNWSLYIDGSPTCGSPLNQNIPTGNMKQGSVITTLATAAAGTRVGWSEAWADK